LNGTPQTFFRLLAGPRHALVNAPVQRKQSNLVESGADSDDLSEHLLTATLLLNHPLQAPHLALNAAETQQDVLHFARACTHETLSQIATLLRKSTT
jgi:hypothetical protein